MSKITNENITLQNKIMKINFSSAVNEISVITFFENKLNNFLNTNEKIKIEINHLKEKQLLINKLINNKKFDIKNYEEKFEKMNAERSILDIKLKKLNELKTENLTYKEKIMYINNLVYSCFDINDKINKNKISLKELNSNINIRQEHKESLLQNIYEKKEKVDQLKEDSLLNINIENLENLINRYNKNINDNLVTLENLKQKRDNINRDITLLKNEWENLLNFQKEEIDLQNKIDLIDKIFLEINNLENIYVKTRLKMRTKNVEALSILLNEMFLFIYPESAYSNIELDDSYNLYVKSKLGFNLEPKLLSGGERAIFNLALRCAIYRLLSAEISKNKNINFHTSTSTPLIFDEPTSFLDSNHIHQLINLIELMKNYGVGQVIVVSHDETLIDSADEIFKVNKKETSNLSTVKVIKKYV